MNKEAKKWHRSLKKLTKYTATSTILNLEEGPISIREHWKEANEKRRPWEDVELTRDKETIEE